MALSQIWYMLYRGMCQGAPVGPEAAIPLRRVATSQKLVAALHRILQETHTPLSFEISEFLVQQ